MTCATEFCAVRRLLREFRSSRTGCTFNVHLPEGQKTGYYLDQRDNRLAVARFAQNRKVLDAFSYSGGFGIYAARAGAASVECVDASIPALELAKANAECNGLSGIEFVRAGMSSSIWINASRKAASMGWLYSTAEIRAFACFRSRSDARLPPAADARDEAS